MAGPGSVLISNETVRKIRHVISAPSPSIIRGWLTGEWNHEDGSEPKACVHSLMYPHGDDPESTLTVASILPGGVHIIGAVVGSYSLGNCEEARKIASIIKEGGGTCSAKLGVVVLVGANITAPITDGVEQDITFLPFDPTSCTFTPKLEVIEGDSSATTRFLSCSLDLSLPRFGLPDSSFDWNDSLKSAFDSVRMEITAPHAVWILRPAAGPSHSKEKSTRVSKKQPPSSEVFLVRLSAEPLIPESHGGVPTEADSQQKRSSVKEGGGGGGGDSPKCGQLFHGESTSAEQQARCAATVQMYVSHTPSSSPATQGSSSSSGGPTVGFLPAERADWVARQLTLSLSVLALVDDDMHLERAARERVVPKLLQQLDAIQKRVQQGGRGGASEPAPQDIQVAALHFLLPGIPFLVTALHDTGLEDAHPAAVSARVELHKILGLPLDRPFLRPASALPIGRSEPAELAEQQGSGKLLLDVHLSLTKPIVPGGRRSLVQGSYEYYHYMQQKMDDNGWGCAYRSLQTIISWFRLQHYTSVPVPTHRRIQEVLVELGDKDSSFVGSSKWIGAIELSYVLDVLLGVSCKILNFSSGADIPTKARELARHFETQGTPIMIGGGVLAYTLLGIEHNEQTGECAFLILDPHYTGGEDLKSIHNGGWCSWKRAVSDKGKEFFLRDAFYNLLLPQRPCTV